MKRITIMIVLLLLPCLLTGCFCQHEWLDATCDAPMTCAKCGETEGEELDHEWVDADCLNPKTCSLCGKTRGEVSDHSWIDASCSAPKTCEVCGKTEGAVLQHTWLEANCLAPETCSLCGETKGEKEWHDWNYGDDTAINTCRLCDLEYGRTYPVSDGACHTGRNFNITYEEFQNKMYHCFYPYGPYYMGFLGTTDSDIAMYQFVTHKEMENLRIYAYVGFDANSEIMQNILIAMPKSAVDTLDSFIEIIAAVTVVVDGNLTYSEAIELLGGYTGDTLASGSVNHTFTRDGMRYKLVTIDEDVLFFVTPA